MAYIKFDVDFISTNDDLAEYAFKWQTRRALIFPFISLFDFFSVYVYKNKVQKCIKSKRAAQTFSHAFIVGWPFFTLSTLQLCIIRILCGHFYLGREFSHIIEQQH